MASKILHTLIVLSIARYATTRQIHVEDTGCKSLPEIEFAFPWAHDQPEIFPEGTTVKYMCEIGFFPDGKPEIHCQSKGPKGSGSRWSEPAFTCEPGTCPEPPSPDHGRIKGTYFVIGRYVGFECYSGYQLHSADGLTKLTDTPRRYCQVGGRWSSETPKCILKECPKPPDVENGRWEHSTPANYGTKLYYNCDYGFTPVGPTERMCLDDGEWGGSPPTCEEVKCETPFPFSHGLIEKIDTSPGDAERIKVTCLYNGQSQDHTCEADGHWDTPLPECPAEPELSTPTNEATAELPWWKRGLNYLKKLAEKVFGNNQS